MRMVIGIIGGGASGLMASIAAGRQGAKVLLFEKMNRVGKKLLATGNGRCNLTNIHCAFEYYHGVDPKFVLPVLNAFSVEATIDFFNGLGIYEYIDEDGKVYPNSLQASSVLNVLRYEIHRLGIKEHCEETVVDIHLDKRKFILKTKDKKYTVDKVILAAGGKASPNLGSNGEGYVLARKLGHQVIPPFPALVQVKLNTKFLRSIKGVKWIGKAAVLQDQKMIREEEGELLFTDYGISGPPILQLARSVNELGGKKCSIQLDLFPQITKKELDVLLQYRFNIMQYKTIEESFVGLINQRLISTILKEAGIQDGKKKCSDVRKEEREAIVTVLKSWSLDANGTNSWSQAQVTAGGISTKDISASTLESKRVPGLYFAGEVLDIDGECGGFNLQWAWSSGYVAAMAAVRD